MVSAEELEIACKLLATRILDREIKDAGVLGESLDLCLFFVEAPHPRLRALRIATGDSHRARVLLEKLREPKTAWQDGETSRLVRARLAGARLVAIEKIAGERMLVLSFRSHDGEKLELVAECFGPRGNWHLLDAKKRILCQARRPGKARSNFVVGQCYEPPKAHTTKPEGPTKPEGTRAEELPRLPDDANAWLEEKAHAYQRLDDERKFDSLCQELVRRLEREEKALRGREKGLLSRRKAEEGHGEKQKDAELLLTVQDGNRRGLRVITVQDWYDEGKEREIQIETKLSIRENAERLFDRARRLREGAVHTETLLTDCKERLANIAAWREELDDIITSVSGGSGSSDRSVAAVHDFAARIGPLLRPSQKKSGRRKKLPETARRPYRSYVCSEGFGIYVGRSTSDNDRLSLSIARGNDIWMHIGGGHAGSHVVIRLDRGKTASLESLLDGATLAVHFSKARGHGEALVIYTPAKFVRKRKGMKPGAVEVQRFKTLSIRQDSQRLARLLATAKKEDQA